MAEKCKKVSITDGITEPSVPPELLLVESKSTSLALTLNSIDPASHLGQLWRYMRLWAVDLGMLTTDASSCCMSARAHLATQTTPCREVLRLDIPTLLSAWSANPDAPLPPALAAALATLERRCSLSSFTNPERMERELALDLESWAGPCAPAWHRGAERGTPRGRGAAADRQPAHARQLLQRHRDRAAVLERQLRYLDEREQQEAEPTLRELRDRVVAALEGLRSTLGLSDDHLAEIRTILADVASVEGTTLRSKKALADALQSVLNKARAAKFASQPRFARPWDNLDQVQNVKAALDAYGDVVAIHLRRQTDLRFVARETRGELEDFAAWRALVQETALGDGSENQQANEFALQAAYVVFIRLLLIRVCEDKGLFPQRFVSDGGLMHWQEDIKRYLSFASGNPYSPLLDMAYANAQNIYAHFFTGREVFNWYRLDRSQLLMALHRLSRFNFASVNADIIGTIYNTYVARKEKKERGQYYTPRPIIDYMLDAAGYVTGPEIIGPNRRLLDSACGSGSFLVAAAHAPCGRLPTGTRSAVGDRDLTARARVAVWLRFEPVRVLSVRGQSADPGARPGQARTRAGHPRAAGAVPHLQRGRADEPNRALLVQPSVGVRGRGGAVVSARPRCLVTVGNTQSNTMRWLFVRSHTPAPRRQQYRCPWACPAATMLTIAPRDVLRIQHNPYYMNITSRAHKEPPHIWCRAALRTLVRLMFAYVWSSSSSSSPSYIAASRRASRLCAAGACSRCCARARRLLARGPAPFSPRTTPGKVLPVSDV